MAHVNFYDYEDKEPVHYIGIPSMLKVIHTVLDVMEINLVHFLAISLQEYGACFQSVQADV